MKKIGHHKYRQPSIKFYVRHVKTPFAPNIFWKGVFWRITYVMQTLKRVIRHWKAGFRKRQNWVPPTYFYCYPTREVRPGTIFRYKIIQKKTYPEKFKKQFFTTT